eukprot:Nk52_evm5s155 gene=Nk52_evmTU5s155
MTRIDALDHHPSATNPSLYSQTGGGGGGGVNPQLVQGSPTQPLSVACPCCSCVHVPVEEISSGGLYKGRCSQCQEWVTFQVGQDASVDPAKQLRNWAPTVDGADGRKYRCAPAKSISFCLNGEKHTLYNVDPSMTLIDFLRSLPDHKGTKLSCGEGGCGACMVTMTHFDRTMNRSCTVAVNSCLKLLCSIDGCSITTTEGLGSQRDKFHELHEKIAEHSASQCGFCTPGMVMSMHGLLAKNPKPSSAEVEKALDGNMCRCTGYRPILDAFKDYAKCEGCPSKNSDASADVADIEDMFGKKLQMHKEEEEKEKRVIKPFSAEWQGIYWFRPVNMHDLYGLLKTHEGKRIKLVVGNTSSGIIKDYYPNVFIDVSHIPELHKVEVDNSGLVVGASVTLSCLAELLEKNADKSKASFMELHNHILQIAGTSVRNAGCWAGNLMVAHTVMGFPSDVLTMMAAAGATLQIGSSAEGVRRMSLFDFISQDMKGCVILSMHIPFAKTNEYFRSFKIMPRHNNAHAYVNAGFRMVVDEKKIIQGTPTIVFGGVGPHLTKATRVENYLVGKNVSDESTLKVAYGMLRKDLDVSTVPPQAPGAYLTSLAVNLFYKFALYVNVDIISDEHRSAAHPYVRPNSSGTQKYGSDPKVYPVSKPIQKLEAKMQASGEAQYTDDLPTTEGCLHAAFVISEYGSAKIESIDSEEVLKCPGVHHVLTAENFPKGCVNGFSLAPPNEEPILAQGEVLYAGQAVAMVIADSQRLANICAKFVKVNYVDIKSPILNIEQAVKAGSFHDIPIAAIKVGDVDSVFKDPKMRTVEGSINIGAQQHFYMEPQNCYVIPEDNNRLKVYSATQFVDASQKCIAGCLNMPVNHVTVNVKRLGGAYGGKITRPLIVSTACAVASKAMNRPIRMYVESNTNYELVGHRSPLSCRYKVAFNDEGRILAIRTFFYCDGGYIVSDTAEEINVCISACDNVYNIPNWDANGKLCKTNTASNCAMRGPGMVPGTFFMENMIDHVASSLKRCPYKLRALNLYKTGDKLRTGETLDYCSIGKVWQDIAEMCDAKKRFEEAIEFNKKNRWRKRGGACTPVRYNIQSAGAVFYGTVAIYADGTVGITHSGIEMGQGLNTKVVQSAAYALGVPIDLIVVNTTSSKDNPNTMCTGGSIGSEMSVKATMNACEVLVERMKPVKEANPGLAWAALVGKCVETQVDLCARGFVKGGQRYDSWGAAFTEVELDILTGEVHVNRVDLILDCGVSLNPAVDIGQCEGAFVMSLGYWLTEFVQHDMQTGRNLTNGTWEYKPPAVHDIPISFNVRLLEDAPNPLGVLRSKASGEPPYCLGVSALLACRRAIEISRRERENVDHIDYFQMDGPVTPAHLQLHCRVLDDSLNL